MNRVFVAAAVAGFCVTGCVAPLGTTPSREGRPDGTCRIAAQSLRDHDAETRCKAEILLQRCAAGDACMLDCVLTGGVPFAGANCEEQCFDTGVLRSPRAPGTPATWIPPDGWGACAPDPSAATAANPEGAATRVMESVAILWADEDNYLGGSAPRDRVDRFIAAFAGSKAPVALEFVYYGPPHPLSEQFLDPERTWRIAAEARPDAALRGTELFDSGFFTLMDGHLEFPVYIPVYRFREENVADEGAEAAPESAGTPESTGSGPIRLLVLEDLHPLDDAGSGGKAGKRIHRYRAWDARRQMPIIIDLGGPELLPPKGTGAWLVAAEWQPGEESGGQGAYMLAMDAWTKAWPDRYEGSTVPEEVRCAHAMSQMEMNFCAGFSAAREEQRLRWLERFMLWYWGGNPEFGLRFRRAQEAWAASAQADHLAYDPYIPGAVGSMWPMCASFNREHRIRERVETLWSWLDGALTSQDDGCGATWPAADGEPADASYGSPTD